MAMLLIYVTEGGNSSGEPLLGEREGAVISASVNLCTIDRATDSLLTASSATFVPEEFKAIVDAVSMGHLPTVGLIQLQPMPAWSRLCTSIDRRRVGKVALINI